jgi:hypothetical protein
MINLEIINNVFILKSGDLLNNLIFILLLFFFPLIKGSLGYNLNIIGFNIIKAKAEEKEKGLEYYNRGTR